MSWVVDTCLLIDVLEADPSFGEETARLLDAHQGDGLVICPLTFVELAPAFDGDRSLQERFLSGVGVSFAVPWAWEDTVAAHRAWDRWVRLRRSRVVPKRPLADVLIGAFALRHQGLLTRNTEDFARLLPDLPLREPARR